MLKNRSEDCSNIIATLHKEIQKYHKEIDNKVMTVDCFTIED